MLRHIDTYLRSLVDEERFAFYQEVCNFGEKEIAPHLLTWERQHCLLPDETIAAMASLGLFGLTTDEQFGGQGGDLLDLVLMGLALGYYSQSVAITPGAVASLGVPLLQLSGSEAQKTAHLPHLASGQRMLVFGLSEPGRGSDAANPETTAARSNGKWHIQGEKCWSTNAKWASHIIVHAMTNPEGRPGHRTTCFLVPMDDPNVHYEEMPGKQVVLQSSTGSIVLDHVEVSDDAIIGEENEGFKVIMQPLNGGRLFIAALALASLAYALDKCLAYTQGRIQFDDQPIGRFQRVQDVILDMDIALEQDLSWLLHLVKQYNAGTMHRESAVKVKIECSRRVSELYILAMEICGGVACLDEFGLMRHARDLFVCRVGEGSNFALKTLATRPLMSTIAHILQ